MFESSVNSDGTQTAKNLPILILLFESSVNSDGTQTLDPFIHLFTLFESSVNSDGTQTLRQRRRAAAVPIDLQTAVRTAVQLL